MSDIVLVGPFWTRDEAAEYLSIAPEELRARNDVLRLEGRWLEETYPALQFAANGIRFEISAVVEHVGTDLPGIAIADWLTRPNPALGAMTPMEWFNAGQDLNTALNVAAADVEVETDRTQSTVLAAAS